MSGDPGPALCRVGSLGPEHQPTFPTEAGRGRQGELAASNRAAVAYSHQVLHHAIGGFSVPEPGVLVACGRSPDPQRVAPAAIEQLLVHADVERAPGGAPTRFGSAAELVAAIDDGAVVGTEALGTRVPFARRLREHVGRVSRAACRIDLRVLGAGTETSIDGDGVGGLVLADGAVDLDPSPGAHGPAPLALGSAVAWRDVGPLTLVGRRRWSAVLVLRIADLGDDALVAGTRPPVPSASVVSELAADAQRRAEGHGRHELFVRSVAPGGLVVTARADGAELALAGHRYRASDPGARAVAVVNAGPVVALAELDAVLGSEAETDAFCDTARNGGWLERCQKGDLLT